MYKVSSRYLCLGVVCPSSKFLHSLTISVKDVRSNIKRNKVLICVLGKKFLTVFKIFVCGTTTFANATKSLVDLNHRNQSHKTNDFLRA